MIKPRDPKELAELILKRSICSVMVSAVLADKHGTFGWATNHVGDGWGMHAEEYCLTRANRKRIPMATLYVAAQRRRNAKLVTARPCPDCQAIIKRFKVGKVLWRENDGTWHQLREHEVNQGV